MQRAVDMSGSHTGKVNLLSLKQSPLLCQYNVSSSGEGYYHYQAIVNKLTNYSKSESCFILHSLMVSWSHLLLLINAVIVSKTERKVHRLCFCFLLSLPILRSVFYIFLLSIPYHSHMIHDNMDGYHEFTHT